MSEVAGGVTAEGLEEGVTVWTPEPEDIASAQITKFSAWLNRNRQVTLDGYEALWQWSVEDLPAFWSAVWDYFDVEASKPYDQVLPSEAMPAAAWFSGAQLNYAEHVLRAGTPADTALVAVDEGRPPVEVTWAQLRGEVGALAAKLRELGVRPGDRVGGYLPNIPAAVVAMLATTGVGAVWTGVSPDFGTRSVLDRFEQVQPTVLIAVDGYRFHGKVHERVETVAELMASLPSVRHTIMVRNLDAESALPPGVSDYDDIVASPQPLSAEQVDVGHPLWVLFSSGTTGKPKGIVQSHGGILLEHLKALGLCMDLGPEDTYFFHSSTSWMAWNLLVGGLLRGSRIVLYSGSPTYGGIDTLWKLAAEVGATVFGMGAAYANACAKAGLTLDVESLRSLRTAIPTGSPLPLGGWRWLVDELPTRTRIDPICGGTDACTVFFGGSPVLPVRMGRISGRWLGVDAHAFDDEGGEVIGRVGEFVITSPMPSMPIHFWGDDNGDRLRDSYFHRYPGVWAQGDWIIIHTDGTVQVTGRSDATLNRGGVRLGSAEIYTVVEASPDITDSLVVGVELPDGEYFMPLFVVARDGACIDDAFRERLTAAIRQELSPRHVPDVIVEVPGLPRTLTGKKLEVPVKRILQGSPVDTIVATGSLDRPELLTWFEEFAACRVS
jgi:acetoacetyl-CoA synthetase